MQPLRHGASGTIGLRSVATNGADVIKALINRFSGVTRRRRGDKSAAMHGLP